MYRTGPFILSQTFDLTPDLLLLGKGTSDMMFPFALTLYSAAVQDDARTPGLGSGGFDQETLRLRARIQDGRQRPSPGRGVGRVSPGRRRGRSSSPGCSPRAWPPARSCATCASSACSSASSSTRGAGRGDGSASASPRSTCSPCSATNASPCWRASASMNPNVLKITPPAQRKPRRDPAGLRHNCRCPEAAAPQGARRRPRRPHQIILCSEEEP